MFFCLRKGIAERVLGIRSRFFGKVLCDHFFDLESDLKLACLQLALLGFENLSLSLHRILLQILLVGQNLGDISHKI